MYIEYPSTIGYYKPDWVDEDRKVIIETKGLLTNSDRKKALLIKKYFPEWLIIFVFSRPKNRLSKKSKTTYADWCNQNEIAWISISDLWKDPKCLSTMIQKLKNGS